MVLPSFLFWVTALQVNSGSNINGVINFKSGTGVTVSQAGQDITFTNSGGNGDVVGPVGATDNSIPTFDGATGKLIKDSQVATLTSIMGVNTLGLSGNYVSNGNQEWSSASAGTWTVGAGFLGGAPSSESVLSVPLDYYGQPATTKFLGEPDNWIRCVLAGTEVRIPCYNAT
jgi:hypothetical protein